MTFLNPLALIGLAAATIPLILHLLNLRKLKTVEFSSLRFLKELQKTKMRRLKIQQILLLIVRTLLVITLVFAFSRPTMKGSIAGIPLGGKTHAKSTIVLLLDDSPSMSVRNERGIVFAQAKEAASRIMDFAGEGDEVRIIRLSEIRTLEGEPDNSGSASQTSSLQAIKTALPKMSLSEETAPFRDAFGIAAKFLAESKNFNQEVYLITDGQATQFTSPGLPGDTTRLFEKRVRIFLVRIGSEPIGNFAVTSVDVKSQIITQNKPATVQALVRNFSRTPLQNTLLNVYLSGARVQQQSLTVPAQSSTNALLSVVPKRRGIQEGYVQLEDDPLEIDNTRYFVLTVPENIAVLLVGNTPQDTRLPALALTLGNDTSFSGLFTVREITARDLSSTDINKSGLLILCGVQNFSATEVDRIVQFVGAGNGLIIFPGDATDVANYNQLLLPRLGIPPMQAAAVPPGNQQSSFLSFDKIDFAHPLFAGLFEQPVAGGKRNLSLESPHVYKSVSENPGQRGHVIIDLGNSAPFLTEYPVSAGRVLLFSVEAGLDWSDFPVKALFAPLLHRAAIYLGSGSASPQPSIVGDKITMNTRVGSSADLGSYVLRVPSGTDERIAPRLVSSTGTASFESAHTTEVGVYELRHKGDLVQASAVNVDPAESDLRPATGDELNAFWARIGVSPEQTTFLETPEKIGATIQEARFGIELWKYCVGLALILALIEMIIGRISKSQSQQQR